MLCYPMCDQTVTLYRKEAEGVSRQVLEGCFYRYEDVVTEDRFARKFLLIHPGAVEIRPGDRVLDGIGPEQVVWEKFLPICVPGLSQVEYAAPWYVDGRIVHWEAGRK